MRERLQFFAPCPRGIESMLAEELRRLNTPGVRPQRAGVLFSGTVTQAYRVALWSRLASRVLLSLESVDASSADTLYAAVRDIPWEDHVRADGSIVVDATGTNDALRNTQFTAVRVKDAICDRFRDLSGCRPDVDPRNPDLRINVVVREGNAKLSLDLTGEPLHRRGYREPGVQVAAPLKETLAAALLDYAGWYGIASEGGGFLDPMCGSGTLVIEAAMMAGDIAPGLLRTAWGFERWLGHDAGSWRALLVQAHERKEAGLASPLAIVGSDFDPRAIEVAKACVRRAGLENHITLRTCAVESALPPQSVSSGLVAINPPYGERLSERAELPPLYDALAAMASTSLQGWKLAVITPDERLVKDLRFEVVRTTDLYNGRIPVNATVFTVGERRPISSRPLTAVADTVEFENRLRKRAKHVGTWARRTGVGCYRVYDADLPDFNVAIDVYSGAGADEGRTWAHVAEYAPPADVDPDRAASRMEGIALAVPEVLGVDAADVFVKRRERQRGTSQYERQDRRGVVHTVSEAGLLFEVNLSDYLDTGLFLDHRDTRVLVGEMAHEKRFLNLYAYTGSATVHAACAGAASTTTVDLSQTYLDWARRNLLLNGVKGSEHEMMRSDVSEWLRRSAGLSARYDLVFCDPPTFSNSKRTETVFDVQRDHVELLTAIDGVLAPGGTIVFSCNRRKFKLDAAALEAAGFTLRDITRRTIPKDFERTPWVHSCWTLTRTGDQ